MKITIKLLTNSLVFLLMYIFVLFSETGDGLKISQHYPQILAVIVIGNITGFFIFFLNKYLGKLIDGAKRTGLKFFLSLVLDYSLGLLIILILTRFYIILFTNISIQNFFTLYKGSVIRVLILSSSILFIYLIIDFLVYSYNEYSRIQIEGIAGRHRQLQLQFEALKTQLSPHYLFNSLNTISALIYKSPNDTEVFIRNLSETYRYILYTHNEQLVSLKKEIQFVKDYLHLLKIRFGDAININIDIPKVINNSTLPPMSVQLLIENAIKHNIFSKEEKLHIEIFVQGGDTIVVRNNILKQPPKLSSFKIGLNNIKSQYGFITERTITVKKDKYFIVELPLIKAGS